MADTLPTDVDNDASSLALLRAKTLVLGEPVEDESPTKISPPDVQSGKPLATRANQQVEAAASDHRPPRMAELPNSGDASGDTLEKSDHSVQPPSDEIAGLVKDVHQTLKPFESEGGEHRTMKPDPMEGDLEASKPDLMEVDPVHHVDKGPSKESLVQVDHDTSKQSEPVQVDGTSKVKPDLKVAEQTPQPSQLEAVAGPEEAAPKVARPADLEHDVNVDIDKIPMVKRDEQQAFKGAKKAKREKGMEESEEPKPEPESTKPTRKQPIKRPAAAKKGPRPKAEPKTKRQRTKKNAGAKDEEKESKEGGIKCNLDDKFKEVAEQAASESDDTPAGAAAAAADDKPEGKKRTGRKPQDAEHQGLRALPTGLKTKSGENRSTFAGRPAPKSVQANNRFIVMLNTFSAKINPLLGKSTSQVEVRGLPKKDTVTLHLQNHDQPFSHKVCVQVQVYN